MPEHDAPNQRMDRLLAQSLSAPVPTLTQGFDRRVLRHVQRHRLSRPSVLKLVCYAAFALVASVWTMRHAGLQWNLIVLSVMMSVVIVATMFRREFA